MKLAARLVPGRTSAEDKADFRWLAEAFKAPGRGPWFDRVRVATSADGLNFTDRISFAPLIRRACTRSFGKGGRKIDGR